jgi:hypothetical protein
MFFVGDTHGNIDAIKFNIITKKITNQDIIHVGDFGVGFMSEKNQSTVNDKLNEFLKERDITLHVFRGNHDNPKYFNGDFIFSNLKFHKDYTVLEIEGKKILGIGGAISIDRTSRWNYENAWWSEETFYLDEEFLTNARDIDILVTHTAPTECPPTNTDGFPPIVMQFAHRDMGLLNDLRIEREELSRALFLLLENNSLTHHFYGHFHRHYQSKVGDLTHMCLDIDEFFELKDYRDYEEVLNQMYSK